MSNLQFPGLATIPVYVVNNPADSIEQHVVVDNFPIGFGLVSVSSAISVSNSSISLLVSNPARIYVHFMNNSTGVAWIQYGAPAVIGRGIRLNPGALLTLTGRELFLGQINAISQTSILIDVLEGQ